MSEFAALFNRNRVLTILCLLLMVTLVSGRSFAGPMYVMIMPVEEKAGSASESRGVKVCLVVKDNRHESVVKTQMCGLLRNGFGGEIGMVALRNQETLETILAHDISDRLTYAGYDVVKVYPAPPEHLSSEHRPKMKGMKPEIKAARKSQVKRDRRVAMEMRDRKKTQSPEPVVFAEKPGSIDAKGGEGWTNGADIVLEVALSDFSSDVLIHAWTVEILGWSLATLSVAPAEEGGSDTISVAEVGGLGKYKAPAATKASWKSALNKNYKGLLQGIESVLLSDDFYDLASVAK